MGKQPKKAGIAGFFQALGNEFADIGQTFVYGRNQCRLRR